MKVYKFKKQVRDVSDISTGDGIGMTGWALNVIKQRGAVISNSIPTDMAGI